MHREPGDAPGDDRTHVAATESAAGQGTVARLLELARMQADDGDVLQSLTSYRAAIRHEPTNADAHAGAALEALECSILAPTFQAQSLRIGMAHEHASRAVELDPASARAHSALARVLPERSRVARGDGRGAALPVILEASAHARRALALDPRDADAHDFIAARAVEWRSVGRVMRSAARVLLGARELDATPLVEALAHACTAVAIAPGCLRYRATLVRALRVTGTPEAAREHLDAIRGAHAVRPSEVAVQRAVASWDP